MFEKTMKDNYISLKLDIEDNPATIEDYIEWWRVRIWEHGFIAMFRGKDAYNKTKAFKDSKHTDIVVRCILYRYNFKLIDFISFADLVSYWVFDLCLCTFRYFMKELLTKGALDKNKLPLFLTTWVDKTSQQCMFLPSQLWVWTLPRLKSGSWYLDCGKGFYLEEEEELKNKLDAADIVSGSAVLLLEDRIGDVDEDDLFHLNSKGKKKGVSQKKANIGKAKRRLDKEAGKTNKKPKKDAPRTGKKGDRQPSKSIAEELEFADEDTSYAAVNPLKRDSTFAGLSNSTL